MCVRVRKTLSNITGNLVRYAQMPIATSLLLDKLTFDYNWLYYSVLMDMVMIIESILSALWQTLFPKTVRIMTWLEWQSTDCQAETMQEIISMANYMWRGISPAILAYVHLCSEDFSLFRVNFVCGHCRDLRPDLWRRCVGGSLLVRYENLKRYISLYKVVNPSAAASRIRFLVSVNCWHSWGRG